MITKEAALEWKIRLLKGNKKQNELAEASGLPDGRISLILDGKVPYAREDTINKIEKGLESLGV